MSIRHRSALLLPISLAALFLACTADPIIESTDGTSTGTTAADTTTSPTSTLPPTSSTPTTDSTTDVTSTTTSPTSSTSPTTDVSSSSDTTASPETGGSSSTGDTGDTSTGDTGTSTGDTGTSTGDTDTSTGDTGTSTGDTDGSTSTGVVPCMMDNDCPNDDLCGTPACVNSVCVSNPIPVDDNDMCTVDVCNPQDGTISHDPVDVDDANVCTTDSCDSMMGVLHVPIAVPSDNNVCTADICDPVLGEQHVDKPCNDNNLCTTDSCDPVMGCKFVANPVAPDNLGCTTDSCDIMTGLPVYTKTPNCCEHLECTIDGPLDAASCTYTGTNNDCATKVCAAKPSCCTNAWDDTCVAMAKDPAVCPTGNVQTPAFSCGCEHSPCVTGTKLVKECDPCVKKVCEVDSFCCNNTWDSTCKNEVTSVCRIPALTCK